MVRGFEDGWGVEVYMVSLKYDKFVKSPKDPLSLDGRGVG
jgi:hypothetical protein